jgi:hypothetical protein
MSGNISKYQHFFQLLVTNLVTNSYLIDHMTICLNTVCERMRSVFKANYKRECSQKLL